MQLPIECIEFILDQLEVWELVPLLTVNSVFFHASATRLYANPTRFFRRFDFDRDSRNDWGRYQAARSLLALVLRYSPAQDPDVQVLRTCLSSELEALPDNPTVDYLSLIKTIPYDELSFGHETTKNLGNLLWLKDMPRCVVENLHSVLVWAACGHRLSDMLDIEILWDDLDWYHHCIDTMTSMRSIRIRLPTFSSPLAHDMTDSEHQAACRVLNVILRFMEKWAKVYAKLGKDGPHVDIQLTNDRDFNWWMSEPYSHMLQRLFELMPVSILTTICMGNTLEWARFCLAPESLNVSYVHTFVADDQGGRCGWPRHGSIGSVLQQLRHLRRLELTTSSAIDYDLFQWAYEERKQTATVSKSSTGTGSLVPLSNLHLTFFNEAPWQSALYGFGATLTTIQVEAHSGNRVDLCAFHNMPNLQSLDLSVDYVENSGRATPFSGCPRLETLHLYGEHDSYQAFDSWDMPHLKSLTVHGCLCFMFHQATLQTMNKLEYLNFSLDMSSESFTWDMVLWTRASFPELKELHLYGEPAQVFAWQMLDQCPALQQLRLDAYDYVQQRLELDSQRWPWPLTPRPTLQELSLTAFVVPQQPYIDGLPLVVPNLVSLELTCCVSMNVLQRRAFKAKFPRLKMLHIEL